MDKTLPDFIADELIAQIYIGHLQAGDRLPAERQFAEQLGVDRTSLRMALRTLNRMNLIHSMRGSGITVLDYHQHAGLDFLVAILDIPELELGTDIKLQSVDTFTSIMAGLIHQQALGLLDASWVASVRDMLQTQLALLEQEPWSPAQAQKLAPMVLALQDMLLYQDGGILTELVANSTRPLRMAVVTELLAIIDVKAYLQFHQDLIVRIGSGLQPVDSIAGHYYQHMVALTEPLKALYRRQPQPPRLRASPLQMALERQVASA